MSFVLTIKYAMANGSNINHRMVMDFANLVLKMTNIKKKVRKKEKTFTIILIVRDVERNLF